MAGSRRWTALGTPVAILMALATLTVATGGPRVAAQEDEAPHPAHIHDGTCDELGDVVFPLSDVAVSEAGEVAGLASAIPIQVGETEVEAPLADILAAPHAINIHRSAEAIQEYIACGDIGGHVVDGKLVIGLGEINESGHRGVAILEEDDDETDVTVYLTEVETGAEAEPAATAPAADDATAAADAAATTEPEADDATAEPATEEATVEPEVEAEATSEPEAEPTAEPEDEEPTAEPKAEAPAGEEVAVDIRDFSFNPDPVEIRVGDTVTWTNQDGVAHTATARARDVLQSGRLDPGESHSQTFEEAGEFEYFCEFHSDMTGTIVVE